MFTINKILEATSNMETAEETGKQRLPGDIEQITPFLHEAQDEHSGLTSFTNLSQQGTFSFPFTNFGKNFELFFVLRSSIQQLKIFLKILRI